MNIFEFLHRRTTGVVPRGAWLVGAMVLMLGSWKVALAAVTEAAPATDAAEVEMGRRIYQEGVLPSGQPLVGVRFGRIEMSGADTACAKCHRRSGMGSVEGDIQVSPITGDFLFKTSGERRVATMDPRIGKRFNEAHEPYTDASLAAAIRNGVNSSGRNMNDLMPRFRLDDAEMRALTAYLRQLSSQWSPGVSADQIHLATVITPDVDPARRQALIRMLRLIVNQKNGSTMAARPGAKRQHMVSAAEMVLGTERRWTLDVWELQGPPATWQAQLEENYRRQPVFALVSGLGDGDWQPVHDFCEHAEVPCWFPSVEAPPAQPGLYSVYFSRGVTLEADLLAQHLRSGGTQPQRVVQVYRGDDYVGRDAAQALTRVLAGSGIEVAEHPFGQGGADAAAGLREALDGLGSGSVVMFWLRPADVAALAAVTPPTAVPVYFSAELARGEQAPFPAAWKTTAQLVYPYELPERRAANLEYFRAWLNMRKVPLVDEVMQSEVFFAMTFLSETIAEMLNNMYGDYLIERAENMLSVREGSRAEQEVRERMALGRPGDMTRKHGERTMAEGARIRLMPTQGQSAILAAKREGTTAYPRLSLAPGQRFASKGGYIVRFADDGSDKLVAETDWMVP